MVNNLMEDEEDKDKSLLSGRVRVIKYVLSHLFQKALLII